MIRLAKIKCGIIKLIISKRNKHQFLATSTLDNQFPHRISLSQAAEITGYHQDYLGQLCRLGKLKAAKIGRNWYTTKSELETLRLFNNSIEEEVEQFSDYMSPEEDKGLFEISQQVVLQNKASVDAVQAIKADQKETQVFINEAIQNNSVARTQPMVISRVVSMPIELKSESVKVAEVPRQEHTLQTLVTRMKLENLRSEVIEMSGVMQEFSADLKEIKHTLSRHEQLLSHKQDLTKNYAPSINLLHTQPRTVELWGLQDHQTVPISTNIKFAWLAPVMAIALVIVASVWILNGVSNTQPMSGSIVVYPTYQAPVNVVNDFASGEVAGESVLLQSPDDWYLGE